MATTPGTRHFAKSTRGRILRRVRAAPSTVDELARELGLTGNAVRAHLVSLERDGMIRQAGTRRDGTVGKPATVYESSPDAESVLSRVYIPLLNALLGSLGTRFTPARLRSLFRETGRRLAREHPPAGGTLRERAEAGAEILNRLGGSATVESSAEGFRIVGCGCPASLAVATHPGVCLAMETMLHDAIGAGVRHECEQGERPSCRFEVFQER
ncbi:MAG TPA: helix-turn-helix domain-containing protein [Gemmatimonadaceae bacterium]|jgi:predicted ArsR family transcriptional regulator|nr:helix-turn-helix domain-containing protein [Gemmatimonadaceae bacterium]